MPETHSHSDEKVREAAEIMYDCGIYLCVPGWHSITNADEAVYFAQDPDRFYDEIDKTNQKETLKIIKESAEKCGASLEDYLHYLKYEDPDFYKETGADDANFYGGRCTATTLKGHQCKNFVRFDGNFSRFKKGISDRCSQHRKKKKTSKRIKTKNIREGGRLRLVK